MEAEKMQCLFCRIVSGEIPSKKVYEDDRALAFHDIDPKAPVHLLVIPKTHIKNAGEIDSGNADIVARLFTIIAQLAKDLKLGGGFRVVTNCGRDGGQTVDHLHFHLLAGRQMGWPPG